MTIELTEQVALNPGPNLERQLEKLRESGCVSAWMTWNGHGSLNYLNSAIMTRLRLTDPYPAPAGTYPDM